MQVVDATDPSALRLVADLPLAGAQAMYAQFQDEYAFIGDHKIDLRTFQSVLDLHGATVPHTSGGGVGIDTSQFALPIGNLLVTGGVGEHQGMAVWAHQAAPDSRGPWSAHIPRAGQTNYPAGSPITLLIHETLATPTIVNGTTFIVRPVGGSAIASRLTFSFDDILTFTPNLPLAANTTYEVVLADGGIRDATGNGMVGYSFTFSTGGTVDGNLPPSLATFAATPYPAAPGVNVSFEAAASDPQGDAISYRFDFGDGTPKTAWGSAARRTPVRHAGALSCDRPGARPAGRRRDPQPRRHRGHATGRCFAAGERRAALRQRGAPGVDGKPRPRHGRGARRRLRRARRRGARLRASAGRRTRCRRRDLGELRRRRPDPHPRRRRQRRERRDRVGLRQRARRSRRLGDRRHALRRARGAGRSAADARRPRPSRQTTAALALGPGPRALALSADGGRLLVTRFLSDRDWGEVWDVATAGLTLTRTIRLPKLGGDANRDTTASGRGVPNQLVAVAIAPDGANALWVAATNRTSSAACSSAPTSTPTTPCARPWSSWRSRRGRRSAPSTSTTATRRRRWPSRRSVTTSSSPCRGTTSCWSSTPSRSSPLPVSARWSRASPRGRLRRESASTIRAHRSSCTTFWPLGDPLRSGGLLCSGRHPAAAETVATAGTIGGEPLPAPILAGKRLFYHARDPRMSAEGYLSCATCHLEGRSDGRVWDFTGRGEGLRRTLPLVGRAGNGQGNVHWSANFDEIQDFEGDIRNAFGGAASMDDDDYAATATPLRQAKAGLSPELDQLAAYVASLDGLDPRSPLRNADGSLTPVALAGRDRFRTLGCGSCHSGNGFTDSTLGAETCHDVGTLRTTSGHRLGGPLTGIDTPTLRGLFAEPRLLHDGSAANLRMRSSLPPAAPCYRPKTRTPWAGRGRRPTSSSTATTPSTAVPTPRWVRTAPGSPSPASKEEPVASVRSSSAQQFRRGAGDGDVNAVAQILNLPAAGNNPSWRHTNWRSAPLEGVVFAPGATNTVEITGTSAFPNISLDEIVVSRPDEIARAAPHRQVAALAARSPRRARRLPAAARRHAPRRTRRPSSSTTVSPPAIPAPGRRPYRDERSPRAGGGAG